MMKRLAPILILLLGCTVNAAPPPADELAKLKAKVMAADYRADFAELARLRDEISQRTNDGDLTYLARYWSGFASWRIAINGASHGMKPDELTSNLRSAATDFYQVIRLKGDFADGYAAASMVNAWLSSFDKATSAERVSLSQALFARANALEPDNPRVLWAKASYMAFRATMQHEGLAQALAVYEQMRKEAEHRGVNAASPLPDWGIPEALMSLAFAHSSTTPPDLQAALDEANAALKLQPEWSYVRDTLKPQIEQKLHAQTEH